MKKAVLKITGKVFSEGNASLLKELAEIVKEFFLDGGKIAVVTGGGQAARAYIGLAYEAGLSKAWQDVLGVAASRINALLFAAMLDDAAYYPIPESIEEFLSGWATGKVVVMGGLQPGQSTNAVSAALAELVRADALINATVVDGVYDKDPKEYDDARLLKKLTFKELRKYLRQEYMPGKYELIDPVALGIAERSGIPILFVNAMKPDSVRKALKGDRSQGTYVAP